MSSNLTLDERLRISLLRFPLALGVVLVHSLMMASDYASHVRSEQGMPPLTTSFLNVMVSEVLGRESRPLFFSLAAILLVAGLGPHLEGFATKLKHRVRSLAVPYLLWNGIGFLFFLSVESLLAAAGMSGKGFEVLRENWPATIGHALGILGSPIDYPLWFVRNLMVLVIVAPAIIWAARRAPALLLACSLALCLAWEDEAYKSADSFLFFTVGIVAGLRPAVLVFARSQSYRIVALYLALACVDGTLNYMDRRVWPLHVLTLLAGLPALWVLSGVPAQIPKVRELLSRLSSCSFLLFATHGLLLAVVLRVLLRLATPNAWWGVDAIGFLSAGLVTLFVVWIGLPLSRHLPKVFAFLTGGRLYAPIVVTANDRPDQSD